MKLKLLIAAFAAAGLAGCSVEQTSINLGFPDIAVTVTDAKSSITVTRNRDKDTGEITYTSGNAGSAEFVFQARPGGQAAYITGYKIISDVIDGSEQVTAQPDDIPYESNINIYVPNGYSCTPAPPKGQSCSINDKTARGANGAPTDPFSLYLAGVPGALVKNAFPSDNHSRETVIIFKGKTATGRDFTITASGVSSTGIFAGTPKANASQP